MGFGVGKATVTGFGGLASFPLSPPVVLPIGMVSRHGDNISSRESCTLIYQLSCLWCPPKLGTRYKLTCRLCKYIVGKKNIFSYYSLNKEYSVARCVSFFPTLTIIQYQLDVL